MEIKNAFDYHNELSDLTALIKSIEYSTESIEEASDCITEDTNTSISIALSLAEADLKKAHVKLVDRRDHIIAKLSGSYF